MYKYKIQVDKELDSWLTTAAEDKKMTVEDFIVQILNKYLVPAHTINQEEMARGYAEMGDINLDLAK